MLKLVANYEHPQRIALSKRFPLLKKPIIFTRRKIRSLQDGLNKDIAHEKSVGFFSHVVARHQSLLRRQLGDSDSELQEKKIINLTQAVKKLNGVVIPPGKIFSLWSVIGQPTYQAGYVDGMLLANGKIVKGIGGGLCQLSNFLFWIFLHAPIQVIERYHHSMDVFPDSGRTLPFGSGATILYNIIDVKVKNISNTPLQLKIWLTDTHLKGQIVAREPLAEKFHVFQQDEMFVKRGKTYYRYNEIFRDKKIAGQTIATEKITENFAPVLYKVTPGYLRQNHFTIINLGNTRRIRQSKTRKK